MTAACPACIAAPVDMDALIQALESSDPEDWDRVLQAAE